MPRSAAGLPHACLRDILNRIPDSRLRARVDTAAGLTFVRASLAESLGELRIPAVLDSAGR